MILDMEELGLPEWQRCHLGHVERVCNQRRTAAISVSMAAFIRPVILMWLACRKARISASVDRSSGSTTGEHARGL